MIFLRIGNAGFSGYLCGCVATLLKPSIFSLAKVSKDRFHSSLMQCSVNSTSKARSPDRSEKENLFIDLTIRILTLCIFAGEPLN